MGRWLCCAHILQDDNCKREVPPRSVLSRNSKPRCLCSCFSLDLLHMCHIPSPDSVPYPIQHLQLRPNCSWNSLGCSNGLVDNRCKTLVQRSCSRNFWSFFWQGNIPASIKDQICILSSFLISLHTHGMTEGK